MTFIFERAFITALENLPLEIRWRIQSFCFTPPTPTPFQKNAMRELYTVQCFWTYFHVYEARQRLARRQGLNKDWLIYTIRHEPHSMENLQLIWYFTT